MNFNMVGNIGRELAKTYRSNYIAIIFDQGGNWLHYLGRIVFVRPDWLKILFYNMDQGWQGMGLKLQDQQYCNNI